MVRSLYVATWRVTVNRISQIASIYLHVGRTGVQISAAVLIGDRL